MIMHDNFCITRYNRSWAYLVIFKFATSSIKTYVVGIHYICIHSRGNFHDYLRYNMFLLRTGEKLSCVMKISDFSSAKTKAQTSHAADQCLCFRYIDSTISLFSESEMPSL